MRILAISGSLRAASHNTALLRVVSRLAPADIQVELYAELGKLPLFNPDLEAMNLPYVVDLRAQLLAADAVLIASPEYAHGVTGVIKNALDWMVGCEAFVNKPVALLNASPRAVHAYAALKETLSVMSALIVEEASVTLPVQSTHLDEEGLATHPETALTLRNALQILRFVVERNRIAAA
ncbi:NADPH-dependent FMN reductase [Sulfuriferula thiophila]|uniref:NADPH-dependent FMN reductase n=1 Tax=Sulfuriferula thiophila TaxID=1781211 RepID=UPI000F60644E|nr:NADPH-dependent FMN reductase [Sulfuriferula thiophila]